MNKSTASKANTHAILSGFSQLTARSSGYRAFFLATALAFALSPQPVDAQDNEARQEEPVDRRLDEIIVRARRRDESLLNVGTSITVFTEQEIVQNRFIDLQDYALKTPNINVIDGASRNNNLLSMRGITSLSDSQNLPYAFYVDELSVLAITGNPQLHDIAQIEILRGPQGTYFGRNASGGAFNLTTNRPAPEFDASGYVDLGNFSSYEVSGMLNVPVTDTFFLRGVAYYQTTDGSVKNVNPIGGTDDQTNYGGRFSARWAPNDRWTIDAWYNVADEDLGLDTAVPTGYLRSDVPGFFGIMAPILDGLGVYPNNTTQVNHNTKDFKTWEYDLVNARINFNADNFSITSVSGWGTNKRSIGADLEKSSLAWYTLADHIERDLLSQELRIESNPDNRVRWTLGAIYVEEDFDRLFQVFAEGDGPFGAPAGTQFNNLMFITETTSKAVFGEVDFRVNEQWTLTYGGRYTEDEITARISDIFRPEENVAGDFDNYSNKFAVNYDASDDLSLYFMASEGYRAGGVQFSPDIPTFDPETVWNYEIGTKADLWDGRFRLTASAFYMDWEDMQVVTFIPLPPPQTITIVVTANAAKATSSGIELEGRMRPNGSFEFGLGIGYLKTEFDKFPDANVAGVSGPQDLSGKEMLRAPEWTINADAEYDFEVGGKDAFVRAEWAFRSEYETQLIALIPGAVPKFPYTTDSFDIWNLRAGFSGERYSVMAYVENVLDDNYFTGTYDDLYVSGVHVRVHPREYGMRISFNYGR